MSNLPPVGTLEVVKAKYVDTVSLDEIPLYEWARRKAIQYRQMHRGEWPTVRQLAIAADVGHGTAARGLQLARGKQN